MVSKEVVRRFFAISGLDSDYFTVAQAMLADFTEAAGKDERTAEELKHFGDDYVEFMIGVYAEAFDDSDMAQLIQQFQTPAFRKLIAIDTQAGDRIEKFLHRKVEKLLGIQIVRNDSPEATAASRATH
jgi:hypothetical protein